MVILVLVRPDRLAGTIVMRRMALVARMELPSDTEALGIEPGY